MCKIPDILIGWLRILYFYFLVMRNNFKIIPSVIFILTKLISLHLIRNQFWTERFLTFAKTFQTNTHTYTLSLSLHFNLFCAHIFNVWLSSVFIINMILLFSKQTNVSKQTFLLFTRKYTLSPNTPFSFSLFISRFGFFFKNVEYSFFGFLILLIANTQ